jgi:Ni,Fe-hydrogenase maturation factor
MSATTTLLVGIGSPHGDDRAGWEVVRLVQNRLRSRGLVRCAQTPAELLDWLDGVERLEICDAVYDAAYDTAGRAAGYAHRGVGLDETTDPVRCWQWPSNELQQTEFRGSHDLSLPAVLELAEALGRLPARVRIWGVPIVQTEALGPISARAAANVRAAATRICRTLDDA